MKYKANYFTNLGARLKNPLQGNNKKTLIKAIRENAEGNTTEGGYSTWRVETQDGRTVAAGGTNKRGTRWRVKDDELKYF